MGDDVKLYELVGELVSDLAYARLVSDKHSCMLSEKYQADPYMNGLPVPHFTISQAEISLPVMITGVETENGNYEKLKEGIIEATKKKAGKLLFDYVADVISEAEKKKKPAPASKKADWDEDKSVVSKSLEDSDDTKSASGSKKRLNRNLLKKYADTCTEISHKLIANMSEYMAKNNKHTFKKIDLADAMTKGLSQMLLDDFEKYTEEEKPYCDAEDWEKAASSFRAVMINEFDQFFKLQSYIIVNPSTGRINEFASNQLVTSIKLVIKEQDMELTVKKGDGDDEVVRALALY